MMMWDAVLYIHQIILFKLIICIPQLGMFVCGAPVKVLEVNPSNPREFVCGDVQGQLYFLSWKGWWPLSMHVEHSFIYIICFNLIEMYTITICIFC